MTLWSTARYITVTAMAARTQPAQSPPCIPCRAAASQALRMPPKGWLPVSDTTSPSGCQRLCLGAHTCPCFQALTPRPLRPVSLRPGKVSKHGSGTELEPKPGACCGDSSSHTFLCSSDLIAIVYMYAIPGLVVVILLLLLCILVCLCRRNQRNAKGKAEPGLCCCGSWGASSPWASWAKQAVGSPSHVGVFCINNNNIQCYLFFLGTPESKHAAEMSQLSTVRQRELSMCHVLPSNRKPWQANAS